MGSREFIEFFSEQNVLLVDVCVDEGELRAVERVLERGAHDLQHGCDARAARDHAELARERRVVLELTLGPLDAYLVAELEERDVAGDVALFVRLYTHKERVHRAASVRYG